MIPYAPLAVGSYVLNGVAVLINKYLLATAIPRPLSYVVYVTATSMIFLAAVPLRHMPSLAVFAIGSLSALTWTAGAYFLYAALNIGLASRVAPVIDTIQPVLFLAYSFLLQHDITRRQAGGAAICVLGLVLITAPSWHALAAAPAGGSFHRELLYELAAALLFATSYILLHRFYAYADPITWLGWSRIVLIPILLLVVLVPAWRAAAFPPGEQRPKYTGGAVGIFFGGQLAGGLAQLLFILALTLATPALVGALQGTEYIFLLVASLILSAVAPAVFSERLTPGSLLGKLAGVIAIGAGLYVLT